MFNKLVRSFVTQLNTNRFIRRRECNRRWQTECPGPQNRRRRIHLIFFDAGGGHRNAATALQVQIERQGLPLDVSPRQPSGSARSARRAPQAGRNSHRGHVQQDAAQWLDAGQPAIDARAASWLCATYHGPSVTSAGTFGGSIRPIMLVSLVPHFNRALRKALRKRFPGGRSLPC